MENNIINKQTYEFYNDIWNSNAKLNYYNLKDYKKLSNFTMERKCPIAVVCGSGPSLADSYDVIKENRDIINVICAETAVPMLIANGITPDIVVNIDAYDLSEPFLKVGFDALNNVKFIASTVSHPKTIEAFGHPRNTYFFNLRDGKSDMLNKVELLYGLTKVPAIVSRANVGEFSLYLACRFLAYKYIAITGLDFCYVDNKIYAEGVAHTVGVVTEKGCMSMINCLNQPVFVPPMFYIYMLTFMKNYVAEYKRCMTKMFNLTKGILPFAHELDTFKSFLANVKSEMNKGEQKDGAESSVQSS